MCTEAFNALLGCYPASTYDIFPFADRATDGRQPLALAFPSEIAASHDILSGARSNPDFDRQIVLVWQWHKRGAVVDKFLGRNLVAKGRVFYRDLASATLENRLATFTALEIADLIKAVEWAIARIEKTCIPRQANPGPKKSFGWAVGNVERILIAEVVSVLWSDQVPEGASTEHVAEIVDLTRSKVVDDGGVVVEHADVAYALGLRRAISDQEASLEQLYSAIEEINRQRVQSNLRLMRLKNLLSRYSPMSVRANRAKRLMARTNVRIEANKLTVNALYADYAHQSNDLGELQRRLKSGDYLAPSRQTPRITGKPRLLQSDPVRRAIINS